MIFPDPIEFREEMSPKKRREVVAEVITNHPQTFNMNAFSDARACRTARCVAGWTLYLAGWSDEALQSQSCILICAEARRFLSLPVESVVSVFFDYELNAPQAAERLLGAPYETG